MKQMIIIALALASFGASAKLSSIVEVTELGCQEARARLKRNGFLYFTVNGQPTKPHLKSYYADGSWCSDSENAETAWLPTKDAKHCPVGYTCVDKNY